MRELLLVGSGGFIGSIVRYLLGSFALSIAGTAAAGTNGSARFPVGTLAVNLLGCLAIGVLAGIAHYRQPWSDGARLFLFTGVLGGFTTFSAFGYETFELARTGAWPLAALNVVVQLAGGLAAVYLGFRAVGYAL